MHEPNLNPAHVAEVTESCIKFRAKYRAQRGAVEYYALAGLRYGALKFIF
jgi:hypothetical protein